jgi:hypothetical protein
MWFSLTFCQRVKYYNGQQFCIEASVDKREVGRTRRQILVTFQLSSRALRFEKDHTITDLRSFDQVMRQLSQCTPLVVRIVAMSIVLLVVAY